MAFIRWKTSRQGIPRAYLIHSYRDAEGKPRHKSLLYLGARSGLTSDDVARLKQKYPHLAIPWDRIKPANARSTSLNPATLSHEELLHSLRTLRLEKGLSIQGITQALSAAGLSRWGDRELSAFRYRHFERAALAGPLSPFLADLAPAMVQHLRLVLA